MYCAAACLGQYSQARRAQRIIAVSSTVTKGGLKGYGCLVDDRKTFSIEIVRWPAQGRRPIDENSGNRGGVAEGLFEFCWKGETLHARNNGVGDSYLFGWSNGPEEAASGASYRLRERALIWRANYHPDGGQLFYPLGGQPFASSAVARAYRQRLVRVLQKRPFGRAFGAGLRKRMRRCNYG
jgi:hypothetical protein